MSHQIGLGLWEANGSISRSPTTVAALNASLVRDLGDRLRSLTVCPQEWGRGGGLHFAGEWRETDTPVLAKVGMTANELHWTQQLAQAVPDLVPTLFASGERLGEFEVRWAVSERIPFGPLGPLWRGQEFAMTLEAGVRFQQVGCTLVVEDTPRVEVSTVRGWLEEGLRASPPGPADEVAARLEEDFAWLISVCDCEVCHHDLHLCNVVTRVPPPAASRGLLIDVEAVLQPWPFDAAYLQVLNSADPRRPGGRNLIPKMADLRHRYGLPAPKGRDLRRAAALCLAWLALRLWAWNPQQREVAEYATATQRFVQEAAQQQRTAVRTR